MWIITSFKDISFFSKPFFLTFGCYVHVFMSLDNNDDDVSSLFIFI